MSAIVSVIIPAWNLWHLTSDCLHSLAQHTASGTMEVIVVDNGSTDATVTELAPLGEALFGDMFTAVRLPHNSGFAKGCNAGAKAASGQFLFFLNNDTVLTPNWLPPLRDALMRTPRVGIAGSLLLYPDSMEVQHCGVAVGPTRYMEHVYSYFPHNHAVARKRRLLQAVTGAAFFMPLRLFEQCEGFCEGYVNGVEDLDLCCTVRRKGLHVLCVPESVILHRTSQTPGRFDHDTPNYALLNQRWPDAFVCDLHRIVAEDGYVPALCPQLTLYASLPPAKEEALTLAFSSTLNVDRCRARLEAEPLWQGGYTLLAERLEQAEHWQTACGLRLRQTQFFPLPAYYAALARTAARAAESALAENAGETLRKLHTPEAVHTLVHKAEHWRNTYANMGDTALVQLFTDWLARYAPDKNL